MSSGLPVRIQVRKAVAKSLGLEGTLEPSRLTRLQGLLPGGRKRIHAQLQFERRADGRDYLCGRLVGELTLQCQRCLGGMPYSLDYDLDLRLLPAESPQNDAFDGIEVLDDELMLHKVIEDELILALPAVAMHENSGDCELGNVPQDYLRQSKGGAENPFAVLEKLKSNTPSTR